MKHLSMLAFGIALAVGCGGKKDPIDKAIAGLEDWKTKMCACKDKACTEKTHEDYKKWENDVMEPMMKGIDEKSVDKSKMEKGDKLDKERKDCRDKFRDAEGQGAAAAEAAAAGQAAAVGGAADNAAGAGAAAGANAATGAGAAAGAGGSAAPAETK